METAEALSVLPRSDEGLQASLFTLAAKRLIDVVIAIALLGLLAPLLAAIALVLVCDGNGAPLYVDQRRGRHGCTFRMLKFRTMRRDAVYARERLIALNSAEPPLFKIPADPRITPVGRFLRRWSLDELPQLANVLIGQMSLVGPRPLILQEADALGDAGTLRLAVRPGMSGPWQVAGGSRLPTAELLRLDTNYVRHWSLRRDFAVLAKTPHVILARENC